MESYQERKTYNIIAGVTYYVLINICFSVVTWVLNVDIDSSSPTFLDIANISSLIIFVYVVSELNKKTVGFFVVGILSSALIMITLDPVLNNILIKGFISQNYIRYIIIQSEILAFMVIFTKWYVNKKLSPAPEGFKEVI